MPYRREFLSLPDVGDQAMVIEDHLAAAHRDQLVGPTSSLLRADDEIQSAFERSGVTSPYVDPAFNSPRVYGVFLHDLSSRNLIRFVPEAPAYLGVFCVAKKSGQLRLIFDTRVANVFLFGATKDGAADSSVVDPD